MGFGFAKVEPKEGPSEVKTKIGNSNFGSLLAVASVNTRKWGFAGSKNLDWPAWTQLQEALNKT